jgi:hypothetical protein
MIALLLHLILKKIVDFNKKNSNNPCKHASIEINMKISKRLLMRKLSIVSLIEAHH